MTRTRWLWVLAAAVLIVGVVTATVLVMREDASTTAAGADCGVVAELAREWTTAAQQDQTGGQLNDELADKARAAADSVSTPALKEDLNTWADGFALLAEVQRADANSPSPTPDDAEKITEAGNAIYETADALREACPEAWPPAD